MSCSTGTNCKTAHYRCRITNKRMNQCANCNFNISSASTCGHGCSTAYCDQECAQEHYSVHLIECPMHMQDARSIVATNVKAKHPTWQVMQCFYALVPVYRQKFILTRPSFFTLCKERALLSLTGIVMSHQERDTRSKHLLT